MEDSPIPLKSWLLAMWQVVNCKNGVSSYEIARDVKVTQKSAWFMLQRIRLAMQDDFFGSKIGGEVEERLLAARISLTGPTVLHGSLHRDAERWRAEIEGIAQEFGESAVWIEEIKTATSPIYDLSQLADRDGLTKIVLESLEEASHDAGPLPEDIREMISTLPTELQAEVSSEWEPDQRSQLMSDVRAIILESLQRTGGNSQ